MEDIYLLLLLLLLLLRSISIIGTLDSYFDQEDKGIYIPKYKHFTSPKKERLID